MASYYCYYLITTVEMEIILELQLLQLVSVREEKIPSVFIRKSKRLGSSLGGKLLSYATGVRQFCLPYSIELQIKLNYISKSQNSFIIGFSVNAQFLDANILLGCRNKVQDSPDSLCANDRLFAGGSWLIAQFASILLDPP